MSAETELNAVKKLDANKSCANCDAYNKFGHQNVCEKFKTFVCSNCKSAHQSYSMRVKSVSMSNWSKEEVDALKEENDGGNAVAKRVWLGRWDESQMRKPTDKDHVDYFKKFINKVYNDRAFYDEDALNNPSATQRAPAKPKTSSQPAAGSFDAFSNSDWSSAPAATSASSADGWGAFASAPASVSSSNDGFGDFASFSAAPPASSSAPSTAQSFDPFGSNSSSFGAPTTSAASVQPVSFDPFGATSAPISHTTLQQHQSAPSSFNQFGAMAPPAAGKNFDAFDALSVPNLAYGQPQGMMPNGMSQRGPSGMGMNGYQPQQQQQQYYGMPQQQPQFQQQQPPMMMGGGGYGANPAMSISTFMNPNANQNRGNGAMYGRPGAQQTRDPFAGLGLPQH
ncbi:Gtpase-activating protein, partial [Globisporangium splendens]